MPDPNKNQIKGSQNAVDNFSGKFDELLGAGFASGIFSDTAMGSGNWYAVRD